MSDLERALATALDSPEAEAAVGPLESGEVTLLAAALAVHPAVVAALETMVVGSDDYRSGRETLHPQMVVECVAKARYDALREEVLQLQAELAARRGFQRSVNEALNSGDGVYRP